jgi:hypothetical protein
MKSISTMLLSKNLVNVAAQMDLISASEKAVQKTRRGDNSCRKPGRMVY